MRELTDCRSITGDAFAETLARVEKSFARVHEVQATQVFAGRPNGISRRYVREFSARDHDFRATTCTL